MIQYVIERNNLTKTPSYSCRTVPGRTLDVSDMAEIISLHNPTIPSQTAETVLEAFGSEILEQLSIGNWVNISQFASFRATIKSRLETSTDPLPSDSINCLVVISKPFRDELKTLGRYNRNLYEEKKPSILSIIEPISGFPNYIISNSAISIKGGNLSYDMLSQDEGVFVSRGQGEARVENVSLVDPGKLIISPDIDQVPGDNMPDYSIKVRTRYTDNGSLRETESKRPLRIQRIIENGEYIMNVGSVDDYPVQMIGYSGDVGEIVFFSFVDNKGVLRLGATTTTEYSTKYSTKIYKEYGTYLLDGLDSPVLVDVTRWKLLQNVNSYYNFLQEVCIIRLVITTTPFIAEAGSEHNITVQGGRKPLDWTITGDQSGLISFSNGLRSIRIEDENKVSIFIDELNPYTGTYDISVTDGVTSSSIPIEIVQAQSSIPTISGWTIQDPADGYEWSGISKGTVNGEDIYVAVSPSGVVKTSANGEDWTINTSVPSGQWSDVAAGDDIFIAVSLDFGGSNTMYSSDCVTWTAVNPGFLGIFESIEKGENNFIAVGLGAAPVSIATTTDGQTWTQRTSPINSTWNDIHVCESGTVIATSYNDNPGIIARSIDDGETWSSVDTGTNLLTRGIGSTEGIILATSSSGNQAIKSVDDGLTWISSVIPVSTSWSAVVGGDGLIVIVAINGTAYKTEDGESFTTVPNTGISNVYDGCYDDNGHFIYIGTGVAIKNIKNRQIYYD